MLKERRINWIDYIKNVIIQTSAEKKRTSKAKFHHKDKNSDNIESLVVVGVKMTLHPRPPRSVVKVKYPVIERMKVSYLVILGMGMRYFAAYV